MQDLTYIYNGHIVLENGIIWDGAMLISGERILQIGTAREIKQPENALSIDANGAYIGPGFVDIHVHGGGGYDACTDAEQAAAYFLSHGETSIFPSPAYSLNFQQLMDAIAGVKNGMKTAKNIKGLYLEGPFTNPEYGAMADLNPWRNTITPEKFTAFVDAAGKDAKVWVIAPERPDLLPFLEYARKVNPNVVFSVGHSEATPMQIRALGKYRPTLLTHALNATGYKSLYAGTRGYGPDEYSLKQPEVYTELICDSCGIHVHPELQQLLLHNKGIHRTVLITDSTNPNGENPENLSHVDDLNFDHNGDLSGSKLTMELACRNIMHHTNCGIAQAFIMASTSPARAVGMDDEIGSIEIGKIADLVFVDHQFHVQKVMLNGKICYQEEK